MLKSDAKIDKLNLSISRMIANGRGFAAAHRTWPAYRNDDCEGMSSLYEGGDSGALAYVNCLEDRNEQRIKDLGPDPSRA